MRSYRLTLILLTILLVVTGTGYLAYLFFRQYRQPDASPWAAIPGNAAFVIRVNHPLEFWTELDRSNLMWRELQNIPSIRTLKNEILFIDSLTRSGGRLRSLSVENPLIIALVPMGRTTFGSLYITTVKGGITAGAISDLLRDTFGEEITLIRSPYASTELVQVILKREKKAFYLTVSKGVFLCSFQSFLIKRAMDQLVLNIPTFLTPGFQQVESTTGRKVEANIYIHYPFTGPMLMRMLKTSDLDDLLSATRFAEWSGLDLHIRKDEILVNGYTFPGDTASQFIRLLDGQSPQKILLPSVIPDNAVSFTWFGMSDPALYCRALRDHSSRDASFGYTSEKLSLVVEQNGISLPDFFLPWTGNEMALVRFPDKTVSQGIRSFAVIRVTDPGEARRQLFDLAASLDRKTDSARYEGRTLYNIRTGELLPTLFGPFLRPVNGPWFTFIDPYILFGDDAPALQHYLDRVNAGLVLGRSSRFTDAFESLSGNANYFFYLNHSSPSFDIRDVISEGLTEQAGPFLDSLRKFETLSFQLSGSGSSWYTSLLLNYNPGQVSEGPLLWQAALDSLVRGRPLIVRASRSGNPAVLVTDAGDNLYMIDSEGSVTWKMKLPGKPLGEVREIFPAGSDSSLFLLNTENELCVVTGQGTFLPKYPVNLPRKATAGLTVCRFRGSAGYQVLIPLDDEKVHLYSLSGKTSGKWFFPSPGEPIVKPVQFLSLHNRDYLFITGESGKMTVTDTKGKILIRTDESFRVSPNSRIYINRTNRKGLFLASSPEGKISYLKETGLESEVTFNLFTKGHTFLYTDINLAGDYEFIFFDINKLYYYDRFNRLIYSYAFPREIGSPPELFDLAGRERCIGIFSEATKEVFLFGRNGLIATDPVIRGTTPFDVGRLSRNGPLNLVIGSGSQLKSYVLLKE